MLGHNTGAVDRYVVWLVVRVAKTHCNDAMLAIVCIGVPV